VWRLERLRLFRTLRWAGLLAAYVAVGVAMPIVTRYQEALFSNLGGNIQVTVPPPTPPEGIAAYLGNAAQLGLLVTVLLAAGSLAFDARPEWAAFLRIRSASLSGLVVPKFAVNAIASGASFALGLVAAWVLTVALIGSLPVAALLAGGAYVALYLAFAVAVVAATAGLARSAIGAGGLALVVLIALPILAQIPALQPWLPSTLVGSPTEIAEGEAATRFLRSAGVAAVAIPALLWVSVRLLARREI
jgi:ABC-2 type transport system permease protein